MLTRPLVFAPHRAGHLAGAALVCLITALPAAAQGWPVSNTMPAGVMVHPEDGRVGLLFGTAVSISNDTAAIGAAFDANGNNASQGSIFVYARNGSSWPQQARLLANEGTLGDQMGAYVEIQDDEIFGGAPNAGPAAGPKSGAVFVFKRTGTTWNETQMLTPTPLIVGHFGQRIAVDGSTLMIGGTVTGGQQVVYVFTKQGGLWQQTSVLQPTGGGSFASHISLSGNTAVVGAASALNGSASTGAAYVFTRSGGVWTQTQQLFASGGAAGDNFGFSVSISADDLVVGASGDDIGSFANQGSATVFHRSNGTFLPGPTLLAPDGIGSDGFGKDLRICGDRIYVGASNRSEGGNSKQGAAYRWDRVGGTWTYTDKFTLPVPGRSNAYFGDHFGVSTTGLVVGAPFADQAYVYPGGCAVDPIYRDGFE